MENKKTDAENKIRNLYCTGTFSQFTYWNYDRIPSKNDSLVAALDWIDIAEAVIIFSSIEIISSYYSHYHYIYIYIVIIIFLVTFIRNIR